MRVLPPFRVFLSRYILLFPVIFFLVSDKKEKQKILRKSLASQLQQAEEYHQLELYTILYETNNDELIRSLLRQIKLKNTQLSRDGAQILGSIMGRCGILDLIELKECKVNDELLIVMSENMQHRKVQVSYY